MALAKRYEDGFNSLDGIAYRVEIWQEGYTGSVQPVAFSSKPLVLKWSETDKQNSTAMLAKINISLVLRIIYLSSNLFKRVSIACGSNPASAAFSQ